MNGGIRPIIRNNAAPNKQNVGENKQTKIDEELPDSSCLRTSNNVSPVSQSLNLKRMKSIP